MKKYKITSPDGTTVIANNIRDGLVSAADITEINKLIADEEAAIDAYDLAISQTQNEECKKVYEHIKKEEVEHLEELRKLKRMIETGAIVDSVIRDSARTITVQCYIFDGTKILIQDRKSPVWHGLAVPGGHVKAGELPIDACIREVKEETGLDVRQLTLFGTHQYKCEEDGESIALLYKTSTFTGELHDSEEGRVLWLEANDVLSLPDCAEGFRDLLAECLYGNQIDDSIKDGHFSQKAADPTHSTSKEIAALIKQLEAKYGVEIKNNPDRRYSAYNIQLVVTNGKGKSASDVARIQRELHNYDEPL